MLFVLFFFVINMSGRADEADYKHTLFLQDKQPSPSATINDAAWIAGYWRGEAWGGTTEEIWSKPLGGSMMASFKFVNDGQVQFYELLTIKEHEQTLILKLKHFNPNLHGWEEKDESVDFRLVKQTPNKLYFEGYTFERIKPDEMNVYVVIDNNGKKKETQFHFTRLPNNAPDEHSREHSQ